MSALLLATGPEEEAGLRSVSIYVDSGEPLFSGELSVYSNQTALDALKAVVDVETEHSSFGDYITCIGAVCQGEGNAWFFYVNGEMAQVGAGSYVPAEGDNITFVLRNY